TAFLLVAAAAVRPARSRFSIPLTFLYPVIYASSVTRLTRTRAARRRSLLRSRDDAGLRRLRSGAVHALQPLRWDHELFLVRPSQGTHRSRSRPRAGRSALGAAACALTLVCVTCKLDKLTNAPPPTAPPAHPPGRVLGTAAAGSAAMQRDSLT